MRVENRLLLEKTIEDPTSTNGWHDLTVDLPPFAGRRIPIQLLHSAPKQHHSEVLWKRAAVVVE